MKLSRSMEYLYITLINFLRLGFTLIVFILLNGCTTYHPMPITSERVNEYLKKPNMNKVLLRIKKLKHPLLKPILFDYGDGLSPYEAAILAVIVNPILRSARDRHGIASAELFQAGILPNPQISYSLDAPSGGITADTNTSFGFGLDWEITSLITRQAHIDSAKNTLDSVDLGIAWQEWQVAQAAQLGVYRVLVLSQQYTLASEVLKRLDDNLRLIKRVTNAGLATELQQSAAETAFHKAHQRQLELDRMLRKERLHLNQLIGLPADVNIKIQPMELPNHLQIKSSDALTKCITSTRLDILGLEKGYASQEASVRASILRQFPKMSIGATHNRDNSDLYTVGFGISIDLPIFDHNHGRIALERATRKQLFDEYVSRIFEARSEIAQLLVEIDATNRLIANSTDTLPTLKKLVETYRQATKHGQADILSYYAVWNDLTNQQIEQLSLKQRLIELNISLELATGSYEVIQNNTKDIRQ